MPPLPRKGVSGLFRPRSADDAPTLRGACGERPHRLPVAAQAGRRIGGFHASGEQVDGLRENDVRTPRRRPAPGRTAAARSGGADAEWPHRTDRVAALGGRRTGAGPASQPGPGHRTRFSGPVIGPGYRT